ncbi:hypothetical protein Tco_1035621 [Tanacetum coccineum]
MGCKKKTNDESGTPRSQSGWKTSWDKKDDKEDQCASQVEDSSNTNQWGKKEAGSSPPSSGKWAAKRKLMMRVGPLVLSLDGKLLGTRRMTKKINVHPEWKTLQTLTNELACLDGKLLGTRRMTKKINVHPEWLILQTLTNGAKRKLDHLLLHLSGWKTSWDKKDDKEDQCASRVEDSSNTNQWGKKEAGSSPPSSGKWAAKRKLMMRVGPLVLSLDGKLLGTRRMTKKINVHPEWKTLQTLTNELACLDGKLLGTRRMTKKINVHPEWKTLQTLTNGAKRKLHLKDDKEDQCASRVVDSSNTNQWGKKEAGSSPPSSGKWAAKRKLMMRVGPLVLSLDGKLLGPRRMTKKINVHPEWKILQTLTNGAKRKLDHLLLHLVNGLLWKTNDESGTPRSQSGWKTSWAKKDDKEDQCASRVEDSSNTNQCAVDGDLRFILKVGSSFCNLE